MSFYHPNIHRCEHIKANGTQCGSPSLRSKKLCFFHERWQAQRLAIADSVAVIPAGISIAPALNMPVLEDADSIQVAIMQVIQLLLTGQLEHRTAALALSGLRTASSNLRRTTFEPYPPAVVVDPANIGQNQLGEDAWKNSDFNVKTEAKPKHGDTDKKKTEKNSPEENGVPAVPESSAVRTSQQLSEDLPPDWKEELRSKIAARVEHAALQGAWINDLVQTAKSP